MQIFRRLGIEGCPFKDVLCTLGKMPMSTKEYRFPWQLLPVILDGISILDVPSLEVKTMEGATSFIQAYGYNPSDPKDIELIWKYVEDAVLFIEKTLQDAEYPKVPEHLRTRDAMKDVRRLILLASSKDNPDQLWACAILRVAHVLIHLAHDPRLRYFAHAQNQILGRLDDHLYVDSSTGSIYLGKKEEGGGIKLLFFKKKDRKDREREIVKMLHKAESTVEVIYDRIGFRLVTETKFDAMRAVRLMINKNIISTPSVRPSRSRNWLIDVEKLKTETERIITAIKKGANKERFDISKYIRRMERRIALKRKHGSLLNPQTSEHYRAIQFTCRELVKIPNPLYQAYSLTKEQLEHVPGGSQIFHEIYPQPVPSHEYIFFPYEIQIMDVKSYADSIFGKSNHEEYRKKQLEVARNRVFGRGRS